MVCIVRLVCYFRGWPLCIRTLSMRLSSHEGVSTEHPHAALTFLDLTSISLVAVAAPAAIRNARLRVLTGSDFEQTVWKSFW
jgi:hypothetical protein